MASGYITFNFEINLTDEMYKNLENSSHSKFIAAVIIVLYKIK